MDFGCSFRHCCLITEQRKVHCWGYNTENQLGYTSASTSFPLDFDLASPLANLADVVSISVGPFHSCAVTTSGAAKCWGDHTEGKLGYAGLSARLTEPPVAFIDFGARVVSQISAGRAHTCAVFTDGTATCWGSQTSGRLGNGATTGQLETPPTGSITFPGPPGTTVLQITAGYLSTCAVLSDGNVFCMGAQGQKRLPISASSGTFSTPQATLLGPAASQAPVTRLFLRQYEQQLANGEGAAQKVVNCAVHNDGSLSCWGSATSGELGHPTVTTFSTSTPYRSYSFGSEQVVDVSVGLNHACAVTSVGNLWCWGSDSWNRLGLQKGSSNAPAKVWHSLRVEQRATKVSLGELVTCLLVEGALRCWGRFGYTGGASASSGLQFATAGMLTSDTALEFSKFGMAVVGKAVFGVSTTGKIFTWGGDSSRLTAAADNTEALFDLSGELPVGRVASDVSCGWTSCCVLLDDGSVSCWGSGRSSSGGPILGMGDSFGSDVYPFPTPFTVNSGSVTAISVGFQAAVAVTSTGKLVTWGDGTSGSRRLGQACGSSCGNRGNPHQADHEVDVTGSFTAAAAGSGHMCAVSTLSKLFCWGSAGNGALGNGVASGEFAPLEISIGGSAVQVSADDATTCIVLTDGGVKCWGRRQIAHPFGSSDVTSPPVSSRAPSGVLAVRVECANTFACFNTANGDQYCWGTGSQVGASSNSNTPQLLRSGVASTWALNQMGVLYTLQDGTVGSEPKHIELNPIHTAPAAMPPLHPTSFSCSGQEFPGNELVINKCYAFDYRIDAPASHPDFGGKKIVQINAGAFDDFTGADPGLISIDFSGHDIARFPSGLFHSSHVSVNTKVDLSGNPGNNPLTCPGLFEDILQVPFTVPGFCLDSVFQQSAVLPGVIGTDGTDLVTVTVEGYLDESPAFIDPVRVEVTLGGRPCAVQSFTIQSAKSSSAPGLYDVGCTAPANIGGAVPISINITDAINTEAVTLMVSHAPPAVSSVSLLPVQSFMDVEGGELLEITGSNFGLTSESLSLYAVSISIPDGTWSACTSLQHLSDISLKCATPASWSNGTAPTIAVTVAGQTQHSSMAPLDYGRPVVVGVSCVSESPSALTCMNDAAVSVGGGTFGAVSRFSTLGSTASSDRLMLMGAQFSPLAFATDSGLASVQLYASGRSSLVCIDVSILNSTHAVCEWPAGEAADWDAQLTVAGQSAGAGAALFDFFPPTSLRFQPDQYLNQTGGDTVVIEAENLGLPGTVPIVAFGTSNCTAVQRLSIDSLSCVTPPGAVAYQRVTLDVAGQLSSSMDMFPQDGRADVLVAAYAPLEITSVVLTARDESVRQALMVADAASSEETETVTVAVLNAGPPGLSVSRGVWVAGVPCHDSGTLEYTFDDPVTVDVAGRFVCSGILAASLDAGNASLVVVVEDQRRVQALRVLGQPRFNESSFSQLSGSRVLLTGEDFGRGVFDTPTVTIGGQPCSAVTLLSDSMLTCLVPPGQGVGHELLITNALGLQSAASSVVFDYTLAVHSLEMLADEVVDEVNDRRPFLLAASSSGTVYTLKVAGASFGTLDAHVQSVRVSGALCGGVTVVSSQELRCSGLPAENLVVGAASVEVVMASGQSLTVPAGLLSVMGAPAVTSISAASGDTSDTIRVFGERFGRRTDDLADVQVAGRSCFAFTRVSQTECTCIVPQGVARNGSVTVLLSTGLSGGIPSVFTYNLRLSFARTNKYNTLEEALVFMGAVETPPTASGFAPLAYRVTVEGVNFGAGRSDLDELVVAGALCPDASLEWSSNTRIVCTALPAHAIQAGEANVVQLRLNDVDGNAAVLAVDGVFAAYSIVPAPVVQAPVRSYDPGEVLVVSGSNFLTDDVDAVVVLIGGQPCTGAEATSRLTVQCTVPASGLGAQHDLQVITAGGLRSVPNTFFSYRHEVATAWLTGDSLGEETPELLQSSLSGSAAARIYDITVGGAFLGSAADISMVSVGGATCPPSAVSKPAQNEVRCAALPAAQLSPGNTEVQVVLSQGNQIGLATGLVEVMGAPQVSSSLQLLGSAGTAVLIVGSNFGWAASQLSSASIGGAVCIGLTWVSSTSIECVVPTGSGLNLPVVVTTAGGLSSAPVTTFSYEDDIPLTPPAETPYNVTGSREVGVSSTVVLTWRHRVSSDALRPVTRFSITVLLRATPSRRLQGDADPSVLRVVTVLLSDTAALSRTDLPDGSSVFSAEVIGLDSRPFMFQVSAANGGGEGPASTVSSAVFEACESTAYLNNAPFVDFVDVKCETCPEGAFCGGGGFEDMLPLAGFYRLPWSELPVFQACPVPGACQGYSADALGVAGLGAGNSTAALRAQLAAGSACAEGYRGLFCQQCARGFTVDGQGLCQPCAGQVEAALTLVAGVFALFVVIVYLVYTNLKRASSPKAKLRASLQKVLLGHIQTVALALAFNLQWPSAIQVTLDAMSFTTSVGGNLVSVQCLLDVDPENGALVTPYRAQVLFDFSLPLLLACIFCGLWLLDYRVGILDRCQRSSKRLKGRAPVSSGESDVAEGTSVPPESEEMDVTQSSLVSTADSNEDVTVVPLATLRPQGSGGVALPAGEQQKGLQAAVPEKIMVPLSPSSAKAGVAAWSDGDATVLDDTQHATGIIAGAEEEGDEPTDGSGRQLSQVGPEGSSPTSAALVPAVTSGSVSRGDPMGDVSATSSALPADAAVVIVKPSKEQASVSRWQRTMDKLVVTLLVTAFVLHMNLTQTALQQFTCTDIGPPGATRSVLVVDNNVDCSSSAHAQWVLVSAVPALLVYALGIPAVAVFLLYSRRSVLWVPSVASTFGFLYSGYTPDYFWWEGTVMLRKALMAVIAVFLAPAGVTVQAVTTSMLALISLVLQQSKRPYVDDLLNVTETTTLVVVIITMNSGTYLADPLVGPAARQVTTALVVAANAAFVVWMVLLIAGVRSTWLTAMCSRGQRSQR